MSDLVPHLTELAERINCEHRHAETALRAGLEHARTAGQLLLEAKRQCRHGAWLPWLKEHVRFSERTAQAYMRIARSWGELEARAQTKTQGLADLTYEDGLKLLSEATAGRDAGEGQATPQTAEYRYRRRSIFTWPEQARHETVRRWWDIGAEYILLLNHRGWDSRRIAEFLGVSEQETCLVLTPEPPPRFMGVMEGQGIFPTLSMQRSLQQSYRLTVEEMVAGCLSALYRRAVDGAGYEGWPETAQAMQVLGDHYRKRVDRCRGSGKLLFDLTWKCERDAIAWYCCAMDDARAALGIEPAREGLLLRFGEYLDLAKQVNKTGSMPGEDRRQDHPDGSKGNFPEEKPTCG